MNDQNMALRLPASGAAWGREDFQQVLKTEIESLPIAALPLQQGLAAGSYVLDRPFQAMIIGAEAHGQRIRARAGIFFSGIVAGCSCADDPTPVEAEPEYCVLQFEIDRTCGDASVSLAEG